MFDIRIYGDPVLRKTADRVSEFNAKLRKFADEMVETMREKDGVGLAATQVGRLLQLVVIDVTAGKQEVLILINPDVVSASKDLAEDEEGCLSIPTIRLKVKRPARVTVKAQDLHGNDFVIENAEGLLARALQHEIDHLNGVMFVDHVSLLQRKLISSRLKKLAHPRGQKK